MTLWKFSLQKSVSDGNPARSEGVEDFLDGGAILEIAIVEGMDAFKEGANDSGGEGDGVHVLRFAYPLLEGSDFDGGVGFPINQDLKRR